MEATPAEACFFLEAFQLVSAGYTICRVHLGRFLKQVRGKNYERVNTKLLQVHFIPKGLDAWLSGVLNLSLNIGGSRYEYLVSGGS